MLTSLPVEGGSLSPRALRPDYKIIQREYETPCWEWQKTLNAAGYGTGSFTALGIETNYAHRAYYIAANGPVPAGVTGGVIDHLCRNPPCVNPAHLEYVPARTNVRRGELARFTDEQMIDIKARLLTQESLRSIALDYEVHENTIWHIANGWTWGENGFGPGGEKIKPEQRCLECGDLIEVGPRHKRFCSHSHRGVYNARLRRQEARHAQL